ncbi:MAG: alpha/beta hydrolase [Nitrospinae bacterium]|nr:alpha/beta hydrolase [Nitrospinota bacterium]
MRIPKLALNAVSVAFLLLALVFALGRWHERDSILHPSREYDYSPAEFGLVPEDVQFNSGGARLHGWYFAGKPGNPVILYIQGNAGTAANRLGAIKGYVDMGLGVFIYEPRGFGTSGGMAVRESFIEDSVWAYDYLVKTRGVDSASVIILGQSLGGVPALKLANSVRCKGVILEGAFISVRQMAKDFYPNAPIWVLASSDFDNAREVKKLKVPLLVIYGGRDDIISPYHSKRLYALAPEPKELLAVEDGRHTDMFKVNPQLYYGGIARFAGLKASE